MVAVAVFQYDGIDVVQMEQVAEQEARWAGADDPDSRPLGLHAVSREDEGTANQSIACPMARPMSLAAFCSTGT
jgi:hypothetical protein